MTLAHEHWQNTVRFLKKLALCDMGSLNIELTKALEKLFHSPIDLYVYNRKWASLYDIKKKSNCLELGNFPFMSTLQNLNKIEPLLISDNPWIFFKINENETLVIYYQSIPKNINHDKLYFYLISWSNTKKQLEWESKHQRLRESLSLIRKIANDLTQSDHLRNLFKNILNVAIDLVQAQKGHIMRYNKESNELVMEVVRGMASPEIDDKINIVFSSTKIFSSIFA